MGCLATFAREKVDTWTLCPTCGQQWTGPAALALARRRHALAAGLPEADPERLNAARNLAQALRVAGQYEEALRLGREALDTSRRVFGSEHPYTLHAMGILASAHAA